MRDPCAIERPDPRRASQSVTQSLECRAHGEAVGRHLAMTGGSRLPMTLWVPRMSSTPRDQAMFMDESADPIRPPEA